MWGWTASYLIHLDRSLVNPTYVGMDREGHFTCKTLLSKPHVCGDGPFNHPPALRKSR